MNLRSFIQSRGFDVRAHGLLAHSDTQSIPPEWFTNIYAVGGDADHSRLKDRMLGLLGAAGASEQDTKIAALVEEVFQAKCLESSSPVAEHLDIDRLQQLEAEIADNILHQRGRLNEETICFYTNLSTYISERRSIESFEEFLSYALDNPAICKELPAKLAELMRGCHPAEFEEVGTLIAGINKKISNHSSLLDKSHIGAQARSNLQKDLAKLGETLSSVSKVEVRAIAEPLIRFFKTTIVNSCFRIERERVDNWFYRTRGAIDFIKQFEIKDQNNRIAIAKYYARTDTIGFLRYIQKFGITDQKGLIELAKLCAHQDGRTAGHIQNFEITDQKILIELAKLCAQQKGWTAEYIGNFGIEDPEALIELAKLCAKQNGATTAANIQNFGIRDREALIEIAKLCAQQNGHWTAQHIKNFGIEDPEALIEIAKLCAQQDGGGTARYIKNFGVEDPDSLIELAKLCAQQDGGGTAMYIKNFGVEDPDSLIELAKLCAQQDGATTAANIQNFGIKAPEALIEIAKLCAQQDGGTTAYFVKNFGIEDPEALIELAKLCAKQNGASTIRRLNNFGVAINKALFEIARLCFLSECGANVRDIVDEPFSAAEHKSLRVCRLLSMAYSNTALGDFKNSEIDQLYRETRSRLEQFPGNTFLSKLIPTEDAEWQIADLRRLAAVAFIMDEWEGVAIPQVFQDAYTRAIQYRNAELAFYMIRLVSEVCDAEAVFDSLVHGQRGLILHSVLPMLIPAKWCVAAGVNPSDVRVKGLKELVGGCRRFREQVNGPVQSWLLACRALDEVTYLAPSKKLEILEEVLEASISEQGSSNKRTLDPEKLKKHMGLLDILCSDGLMPQLQSGERLGNLEELLNKGLLQDHYLNLRDIEGLAEKYTNTLGNMRVPSAWKTYEAQMKKTGDVAVQEALQKIIVSILEGNFKSLRYQEAEQQAHVEKICEAHRDTWERWKSNDSSRALNSRGSGELASVSFSSFLDEKHSHQHLSGDNIDLALLRNYLDTPANAREQFLSAAVQEPTDPLHAIQLQLIQLYRDNPSGAALLKHLSEMDMGSLGGIELANDLKGLRDQLQGAHKQVAAMDLELVDTDDWQDLFLCGTEVAGSCQRVDGSHHLNKGLLGYLLDGKNRMLAVKDGKSGKVLARCLFRLLWDKTHHCPALFQDKIYPSPCSAEMERALNTLAKVKAQELGLHLYVNAKMIDTASDDVELASLGSPAPFEYEDAAQGVMENGKFTLRNCSKVVINDVDTDS